VIGLDDDIRRAPVDRFYGFRNPEHANNHVSVADTLVDPPIPGVPPNLSSAPRRRTNFCCIC
jgi:hypothetical protein